MNIQKLDIYIAPEARVCSECERRIGKYEDAYLNEDYLLCEDCLDEMVGPCDEFDQELAEERLAHIDWLSSRGLND